MTIEMKKKRTLRKKLLYALLGLLVLVAIGGFGAIQYFKSQWFRDRPNNLKLAHVGTEVPGDAIPFEWSASRYEGYTEPHDAILIPVTVPGLPNKLYMQFDTGSPFTSLRPGALASLQSRGIPSERCDEDGEARIRAFEILVGNHRVSLSPARVRGVGTRIDWDKPDAVHIIGSLGADFIDQRTCVIDFPAQTIRLFERRPEALSRLGSFTKFSFKGRRIMVPAVIDGAELELLYDSGCSAFGLLTSKYHFDRYTDPDVAAIQYDANSHGKPVPVHHRPCALTMRLGSTEMPLERVSYVEWYDGLQAFFGRFTSIGGFLGNKGLTTSTLILDTRACEFLVVPGSIPESGAAGGTQEDDSAEVARWIRSAADALRPEQKSYGRIEAQLAAAQIVGLGEATHGQHEAFDLKRKLTMHLIRNHGFRVVAYEASASRAVDCDDYVAGRTDDRNKAIAGLGMLIWQVEENGKLLDELRAWNEAAEPDDRVRFLGCDAQSGKVILRRLTELLGEEGPATRDILAGLLDRSPDAVQKAHGGDRAALEQLLTDAEITAGTVRKLAAEASRDAVAIDLRMREFLAHLGLYGEVGARDRAMAELLLAQLDATSPKDKCVVWGHNAHIQRAPLTHMRSESLAMGGHLAKALGERYYALGFTFGRGEFQANARDAKGKWGFQRYRHSAAPRGSLGATLGAATAGDFLLDFRSAPASKPVQTWLHASIGHRWWGGYNVPDDLDQRTSKAEDLSQCTPGKSYDGLAFHHRTTAARPVNPSLILEPNPPGKRAK